MNNLYDENGKYIGWKIGKPYYLNHGPHTIGLKPLKNDSFVKDWESIVCCEVCKIILTPEQIKNLKEIKPWDVTIRGTSDMDQNRPMILIVSPPPKKLL